MRPTDIEELFVETGCGVEGHETRVADIVLSCGDEGWDVVGMVPAQDRITIRFQRARR